MQLLELPQERYNAEWVAEKRVGIVLRNFREVVSGVAAHARSSYARGIRKNVGALENRAIFEIPEILEKLLRESADAKASGSRGTALQSVR